jgi:hypothetical protein
VQDPSKKQDKLLEHESGFLGDTYAKLQPDAGNSDWLIYFKDFEVFKKSDTFVLDPVKVFLVPEAEKRNIDQADLNELADYFTKAMKDEFQAGHYNLVTEPGPEIMVLRFAITNVEPNGGKTNAVISGSEAVAAHAVVPVPGASMLVPRLKVGRVSIEGQMVDSTSGDVQMAFMTSKSGRRFFSGLKAFQKWGDIDANLTGLGDIVPHAMQVSAMKRIFDFNVMKFGRGEMGAANGMAADGSILTNTEAKEVWVGTTLGYAGLLMSEGMKDEAYKTTRGLYHVIYESKGYWFRTPEAWDITGNFRAGMYMRPTAIWALEMTPPRAK